MSGTKIIINGQTVELGSSGSTSGGTVQWEDINGRPDLSNVSSMKSQPVVLSKDLWDGENEQTAVCVGVVEDQKQQLIVTIPDTADEQTYFKANIRPVEQLVDGIVFRADKVPEQDITVNVYIVGATEIGQEFVGEFVWWPPEMTSNVTPEPYVVSSNANSNRNVAYYAFDGIKSTVFNSAFPQDGYIQFDFGQISYISGIRLTTGSQASEARIFPKIFTLQGSNDENKWATIYEANGTEYPTIVLSEERVYKFNPVAYRYYRLIPYSNYVSGSSSYCIAEWEFYKLEDAT